LLRPPKPKEPKNARTLPLPTVRNILFTIELFAIFSKAFSSSFTFLADAVFDAETFFATS
jgi:hypothetical protein